MNEPTAIFYPPEFLGQVHVKTGVLKIGDLEVKDVGGGYPDANVFVQRVGGDYEKLQTFPVGKIIIEIIGDGTAQEELDAQNAEAELHPLGVREYWRAKGMWDEDDNEEYERDLEEQDEPL